MLSGQLRFENSPEVSHTAGISGRGRGRALELAEALAGRLSTEGTLAALKLGRVARAIVATATLLEPAVTLCPVAKVSGRVPLLGLSAVALAIDTSREGREGGQKDVHVLDHRGRLLYRTKVELIQTM